MLESRLARACSPLVLGWAASKPFWKVLRAEPPRRDVRVPIAFGGFGPVL